jgi:hypothetical protein
MKFYEIPTDDGLQLVDTQAEAKAAGIKNPEPFEVPTDKDGLRDHINELRRKASMVVQSDGIRNALLTVEQPEFARVEPLTGVSSGIEPRSEASFTRRLVEMIDAGPIEKVRTRLDDDKVVDHILESDSFTLSKFFAAVMEKADRVRREISGE